MMSLKNMVDTKTAAEMWGMSNENVKKLAQAGEIEAKKIGGVWVIDISKSPNPKKYKLDK